MKPIIFPQDELPHNSMMEWWYCNGNLKDSLGNSYAFMNCLFKTKVKKVKIPFLKNLPLKTLYFTHQNFSRIASKSFSPYINYITFLSKDSFSKPLLYVNYTNPLDLSGYFNYELIETKKFEYRLKTEQYTLYLKSKKKPLLVGGNGYLNFNSKKTYYYSLTHLDASGVIHLGNKTMKAKGIAWMDHQWANIPYSKDTWTWFSLQMENNLEILCFEYNDGKKSYQHASLIDSYENTIHTKNVIFTPLNIQWTSQKTKANYTLSWNIKIPSELINFNIFPVIKKQEMIFGTINYWEGPISVEGVYQNKKISGVGFMEIVGRPSQYTNIKFLKDSLLHLTKKLYGESKLLLRK